MKINVTRQEILDLDLALDRLTIKDNISIRHPLRLAYPLGRTKRLIRGDIEDIKNVIKFDDEYYQELGIILDRFYIRDNNGNPQQHSSGGFLVKATPEYVSEMKQLQEKFNVNNKNKENLRFLKENTVIEIEPIKYEDLLEEMNLDDIASLDVIILPLED